MAKADKASFSPAGHSDAASAAKADAAGPPGQAATIGDPPVAEPPAGSAEAHLAELKACSRTGDVGRAEELFEMLRGTEADKPSVEAYNFLIHACATKKDPDRAEHFMEEMEAAGVEPTPITYNSVINACAAAGDAYRAQHWLVRMINQGMQPTQVTYGTLCKVFARQGMVSQVRSIMEMVEGGGGQLNEYFFASLISACGAAEPPDSKGAIRAFNDLVSRGLRPQSVKRALERVVGVRQTAQMFANLARSAGQAKASSQANKRPPGSGAGAGAGARSPPGHRRASPPAECPAGPWPQGGGGPSKKKPEQPQRPAKAAAKAAAAVDEGGGARRHAEAAPPASAPPPPRPSAPAAKPAPPLAAKKKRNGAGARKTPPAFHAATEGTARRQEGGELGEPAILNFAQASESGVYNCGYVPGARLLASAALYPFDGPHPRWAVLA